MKKQFSIFNIVIILFFNFLFYSDCISAAKSVFIIDAPAAGEEKIAITCGEGYIWQSLYANGDVVKIGGDASKFTEYLGLVNNDDKLYILTHGTSDGKKFLWNGREYTGFRKPTDPANASLMTLPAGFDNLRRIKVSLFWCFSKKDPGGGDLRMTVKMYNALGSSNTNTVVGFEGKGTFNSHCETETSLPERFDESISKFQKDNKLEWLPYPPPNRKVDPVADNQKKRLQDLYNGAPFNGKVTVVSIKYSLTREPNFAFEDSCNCECDTLCNCVNIYSKICHDCTIDGPDVIAIGTTINFKSASSHGFWTVSNYPPCNASIPGINTGDSIFVFAGNTGGHFNLYFVSQSPDSICGDTLCNLSVYVDDPLPVELSSFNSMVSKRNVILNWTTVSEENNSGFEIERSYLYPGYSSQISQWLKIGFIQGHGTVSYPVNYNYENRNLISGRYKYRLKQIDYNGNFKYYELQNEIVIGTPEKFALYQNYPNPFNPLTKINYDIPKAGFVTLKIFDINGKEVMTVEHGYKTAGYHTSEFDGSIFSSGAYYYRISVNSLNESGFFVDTKKMILLK